MSLAHPTPGPAGYNGKPGHYDYSTWKETRIGEVRSIHCMENKQQGTQIAKNKMATKLNGSITY